MNESQTPRRRRTLSSWVVALIVAFVSSLVLIALGELLGRPGRELSPGEIFAAAVYAAMIAVACFTICRRNPRSTWYVPVICNAAGIIAACVEPNFWITPMWIPFVGTWSLAAIGAVFGARAGIRAVRGTNERSVGGSARTAA